MDKCFSQYNFEKALLRQRLAESAQMCQEFHASRSFVACLRNACWMLASSVAGIQAGKKKIEKEEARRRTELSKPAASEQATPPGVTRSIQRTNHMFYYPALDHPELPLGSTKFCDCMGVIRFRGSDLIGAQGQNRSTSSKRGGNYNYSELYDL